ncbi:MAG: ABC transporter ATP-binding protein [Actinomycetia bacterium]|nr:ABC transporter ATP-binding protein [Actinomycetes bacterium]
MSRDNAIVLDQVVKTFGPITAVNGLSLEVPRGIVLGLLGPNGAGKSTTMRMLTGQSRPTSGAIKVLGFDIPKDSKQARARMGVVPQMDNLDTEMTVEQNLTTFAALYRIPRRDRREALERALDIAQLSQRRDAKVTELSGGMKRRLLIARGLVHDPELVLLDEPTVGLDPQVRQELWSLIDALRSQGTTVLMSTHYIEEAERLADDVAVLSHGAVIARGTPHELRTAHVGERATEFYGPPDRLSAIEQAAQAAGLATRRTGPSIAVLRSEDAQEDLLNDLGDGVHRAATLEDVFVLLTGEVLE